MHTLSSTGRPATFLAALLVAAGVAPSARGQALPQSTPSSDWAAFSSDAGTAPAAAPPALAPTPPPMVEPPPPAGFDGGVAPASAVPPPPVFLTTPAPMVGEADAGLSDAGPLVLSEKTVAGPQATPGTGQFSVGSPDTVRLTSSLNGPVGLYKVLSAEPGTPGVLRFGLTGEFFGLNDYIVVDNNVTREAGTLTLGFSPVKFFDIYLATQVTATNSTGTHGTDPSFISELGDFSGGIKLGGFVTRGFGLAVDLRGAAYSGVGTNGLGAGAFLPTGIATFDFTQLSRFPLRLHLNVGGRFGDLTDLGVSNGTGNTLTLRAPEQFALGSSAYNSEFRAGFGLEIPLPYLSLFGEYNLILPTGTGSLFGPTYVGPNRLPTANPVNLIDALPHDVAFGARLTAAKDVSFLVGGDIALNDKVAVGVPILPEYQVFAGLTYNVDLFAQNKLTIIERASATTAAPIAPVTGIVNGTVLEQDSKAPIAGALVQATGTPGLVASDATGHFVSYELPSGPADLSVSKEGYKAGSAKALVVAGQPASVEVLLEREAKPTSLKISAHSNGKPVAAQVLASGPAGYTGALTLGEDGSGVLAVPGAGGYSLTFTAVGFLGTSKRAEVAPGGPAEVDAELKPAPKKSALIITQNKIRLKRQVHFETGKALILPDSDSILEELLGAILSRNVSKLRVEGHTDNVGGKAKNQALSQDRADAVMQWLISHGVPQDKIEAVGYGDSKPVAPNLTSRGRSLNRRVEFDLL